jgi:hypothetical protein
MLHAVSPYTLTGSRRKGREPAQRKGGARSLLTAPGDAREREREVDGEREGLIIVRLLLLTCTSALNEQLRFLGSTGIEKKV